MAAVVFGAVEEVCSVPWLVRKATITTAGTDATALTHGGPAAVPDMVLITNTIANPTGHEITCTAKSTTTVTIDCQAASGTADIYIIWFDQAAGGIS